MHLLAVVPLYPPGSRVGAWLATHGLLRYVAEGGHTVEVVPYQDRVGSRYKLGGVQVLPLGELDEALERADVILTHAGGSEHYTRLARATRRPTIVMVHASTASPRSMSGASLVVCNSEATKARLQGSSPPRIVIRPYTDQGAFKTEPGDRVTLINLMSEKGGDVFWSIAAALPNVNFLGVLGGYGQQVVRNYANVEVVPTTGKMREEVYARTKVLLIPSMAESWGMVAVEAMASGIPILARPTPGLRECLGSAATWVDSVSTNLWVSAVRTALVPSIWESRSRASLGRAEQLLAQDDRPVFLAAVESLADGQAV